MADRQPQNMLHRGQWKRARQVVTFLVFTAATFWLSFDATSHAQTTTPQRPVTGGPDGVLAAGDSATNRPDKNTAPNVTGNGLPVDFDAEKMLSPGGLPATLKVMLLLTVLSLAPSVLIMTTCFIRFVIVLGLLRQALGTQQLPPNQVIVSLCLFLTFLVMAPVWQRAYEDGIQPYTDPQPGQPTVTLQAAFQNTVKPLREFMADQIEETDNSDAVWMFLDFQRPQAGTRAAKDFVPPESYDDIPLSVLLPAFMLSELKTAFVIGFIIYLPFLVIDMVVSSILISMGMMMLPPVLISLPFKLLLFILIDGWFLTIGMLINSVKPFD